MPERSTCLRFSGRRRRSSELRFSTKFGRVKKRPRPSLPSDCNGNVTAEVSFSACAVVNSLNLLTGWHINVFTFILVRDVLERRLSFFIFLSHTSPFGDHRRLYQSVVIGAVLVVVVFGRALHTYALINQPHVCLFAMNKR